MMRVGRLGGLGNSFKRREREGERENEGRG